MRKESIDPEGTLQRIRTEIQQGLSPDRVEDILAVVHRTIHPDGRSWRKRSSISVPTFRQQRAIHALKQLDRNRLNELCAGKRNTPVRIPGLLASCEALHDTLDAAAVSSTGIDIANAYRKVCTLAASVREALGDKSPGAHSLSARSFRAVQWLLYLEDPDAYEAHIGALGKVRSLLQENLVHHKRMTGLLGNGIRIRFYPGSALFRMNTRRQPVLFTIHEGFVQASAAELEAVVRTVLRMDNTADKQIMRAYSSSESYLSISRKLMFQTAPGFPERGIFHNLKTIHENHVQNLLPAIDRLPLMRWMSRESYRTYGVYQSSTDTIRLSPVLDHPDVPEFVVGYVLFHEIAHACVGTRVHNGRHQIHSKRFYAVESKYPQREEASYCLRELSRRAASS